MDERRTVMVVFGTRPEAIKLAPVIAALRASESLSVRVCVTGQHREMLDPMLAFFEIRPDHDLAVMRPQQDLAGLTARLLDALPPVLRVERPDAVLVQGDTTTTLAASLAAYYLQIPTGHVEAGLRTGDTRNPFPEEINRRITTQLASWHFAPTVRARQNLLREGIPGDRVVVTGNTIVDALHDTLRRMKQGGVSFQPAVAPSLLEGRRLLLVTGHRRESFGAGLRNICEALRELAESHEDVVIVYPVHLNPSVQRAARDTLGGHPRVLLTPPLDYLPFVDLMRRAYLVLTDSGGIQEEAPSFHVPVLVMRETTERPEGIDAGVAELVGTGRQGIVSAARRILENPAARQQMVAAGNPYGDGTAAAAVVDYLEGALA